MQTEELIIPCFEDFKEYFLTKYPFNEFSKELKEYPNPENITQEFMDKYFFWYKSFSHYKCAYWQGGLSSYIRTENPIEIFDSQEDVICVHSGHSLFLTKGKLIANINRDNQKYKCIKFDGKEEYGYGEHFFCLLKDFVDEGFGFKKGDNVFYLKGDEILQVEVYAIILDRSSLLIKSNNFSDYYKYNNDRIIISKIHSSREKIFLNKEDAEQYKLRRDEKEKDVKPFQYTVENKDGVDEYSEYLEMNRSISLIRIQPYDQSGSLWNCVDYVFYINDLPIIWSSSYISDKIWDIQFEYFIKNTKEIKFKMKNNSKIKVTLYNIQHENIEQ